MECIIHTVHTIFEYFWTWVPCHASMGQASAQFLGWSTGDKTQQEYDPLMLRWTVGSLVLAMGDTTLFVGMIVRVIHSRDTMWYRPPSCRDSIGIFFMTQLEVSNQTVEDLRISCWWYRPRITGWLGKSLVDLNVYQSTWCKMHMGLGVWKYVHICMYVYIYIYRYVFIYMYIYIHASVVVL